MRAADAWRRATAVIAVSFLAACAAVQTPDGAIPIAQHSTGRPDASGPDARLAAALAPLLLHQAASLAVGVVDQTTGATATYHATRSFDTAKIVKADILAVLLPQHQQIGASLSGEDQALAARVIEDSDNGAAPALWNAVGGDRA